MEGEREGGGRERGWREMEGEREEGEREEGEMKTGHLLSGGVPSLVVCRLAPPPSHPPLLLLFSAWPEAFLASHLASVVCPEASLAGC